MAADGLPVSTKDRVYNNILESIGNTPLIRLSRIDEFLPCPIYAKAEFFNPGGSVKDRIGLNMILEAEGNGRLKKGGTVVEATSGNTGVGLAIACAILGYKAVFVMPDKMSLEKIQLLRAFGARVVIAPTAVEPDDPRSYYRVADRIVEETPNSILANQYHNPENPRSHYETTGPEIWRQTQGLVTDVVVGLGTGGTVSGMGKYLKEQNPEIRVVGVDPTGSILLETWKHGSIPTDVRAAAYKVEGIGEDFLPSTLDLSIIDDVIRVTDRESFLWTRRLVKQEGIFAGGSSGSAVAAAVRHAQTLTPDRLVVVILPDSGSRYLSKVFDDKWMRENGFLETTWAEVSLAELLAMKPSRELISVRTDDRLVDVINLLKTHDISQVPAVNPDQTLAGMVAEVDLLNHMLTADHAHLPDETISPIVQNANAVYAPNTTLGEILPVIMDGQVVLVLEGDTPSGILTKIDILDFIAQEI
ncbi:MAG TPA: pyridoxal-phosphate dependent enzyme [Anaerolineales bacterium]|nr:pyridoxal-phosphate dependent enzyme [Anaerolineales bacterium]